jgi:endonuclease/exonuclease/phosphatase family metal-dependent hydrolase
MATDGEWMEILTFNVGYFLGYRSQREWLRRPHRLFVGSERAERSGMDVLTDVLVDRRPDVVALQEVDRGSFRSRTGPQDRALSRRFDEQGLEYDYRIDTKYGPGTLFGDLPVLTHMSNMLLWNEPGESDAAYLSDGTKRLVQRLELANGVLIMSVHLSKTINTRRNQLEELRSMVADYDGPVVVAGDFNVKSRDELEPLTHDLDMRHHSPGKTFSTAYPTHAYDAVLTTSDLTVTECSILYDADFSDHLPVAATIRR